MSYIYSGLTDIGIGKEKQEDYIVIEELDENNLLSIVADGTQSIEGHVKPAMLVSLEIKEVVQRLFHENKDLFLNNTDIFLKEAMFYANRVLGAMKMGNEELFAGYAVSLTVCVFTEDNKVCFAHSGNTRMYVIRKTKMMKLTTDQTKADQLWQEGIIQTKEEYYTSPDRLVITGGLGLFSEPDIIIKKGKMMDGDIYIMTTDGIHYAINENAMKTLVLNGENADNACHNLIMGAKEDIGYPDNMSVIVIAKNLQN